MKKKFIVGFLLVSCMTLSITGCGKEVSLKNGEKEVATYKKGEITSDELYKKLKDKYGVSVFIDLLDKDLFEKAYKTDDEETSYIDGQVSQMKSQYNNDEKQFLTAIQQYLGVKNEKELREMLSLEYKRDKAIKDAVKDGITDDEIQNYYETTVVGDITVKHILIAPETTEDMSADEKEKAEEKALEEAKEIIKKLKDGKKFESLAKKYSDDDATKEEGGQLEPFNQDSGMDENFLKASIGLEVGKYTEEPVKSTYGYHVILKEKQEEKPKLKKVKDSIVETLAEKKLNENASVRYEALMDARKKKGLEIKDSSLKKDYEEYMQQLIDNAVAN